MPFNGSRLETSLCKQGIHDFAMNVGKAEVSARIPVGQLLVIQAQKMKDGGLEIVNVYFVLDRGEAKIIGCPVDRPALCSASAHEHGKSVVIVIAPVDLALIGPGLGQFYGGSSAKFPTP